MTAHPVRRVMAAIAALGLAAALPSCAALGGGSSDDVATRPAPAAARPKPGGRLLYGLEADPNGLDPTKNAWDNSGIQLANALYDPLVAFDTSGRPQPYLAESLAPMPDFLGWTIKLRADVVFSNGDPLDADALVGFVEGLRRSPITGPPASMISGVEKLDELTVRITTSKPWATMPALLAGQGGYVVSPKQIADPEGHSRPIGTGPFVLTRWEINKRFELVRNPRYWRTGLPYLDGVTFEVEERGNSRIARLQDGSLDATVVSAQWDLAALDSAVSAQSASGPRVLAERDTGDAEKTNVVLNTTKPPLNDVRIRHALGYATDVLDIFRQSGWPLDRRAQGPLDPRPTSTTPSSTAWPSSGRRSASRCRSTSWTSSSSCGSSSPATTRPRPSATSPRSIPTSSGTSSCGTRSCPAASRSTSPRSATTT
jgi:peptide/nickel transport system substrate-binding protein